MNKAEIPKDSLINHYLPADYTDTLSKEVAVKERITPDAFFEMTFSSFPSWIEWLLQLRNVLVKPFGLDTESRFFDAVCERSADEIIWGMPDKHLDFHVSMRCGALHDNRQELSITTVVRFNNALGRLYFFVIRCFHGIIIRSLLNGVERKLRKKGK